MVHGTGVNTLSCTTGEFHSEDAEHSLRYMGVTLARRV